MKKGLWISLAILALLAASYPGVAWYSGKVVETRLRQYQKQMLEIAPYLTVVSEKYERGVYRSTQETTYEAFHTLLASVGAVQMASGKGGELPKSLRFTVRSRIEHGPFPGFGPPALARIESEFVLDEAVKQSLAKLFGERKPIEIVTRLEYSGAGETDYSSPSFERFPVGNKGETLSWKGFKASMAFGADLRWIKMRGEAPGMEANSPNGESVQFAGASFEANSEIAYEDLYLGDGALRIKTVRVAPGAADGMGPTRNLTMDGLEYVFQVPHKEDYLDVIGQFAIAGLRVEDTDVKDLHYDLTVKHLHGPTVAALSRAMRKVMAEGPAAPVGEGGATIDKEAKRLAIVLLEHEPVVQIDRITFAMAEGVATMTGSVQLVGFEAADLEGESGPMGLMQKIDARADIDFEQGLLKKFSEKAGGGTQLEQQLANLEAQGYVTRDNGHVKTHIEFKQGALTFNGKAFSPQALAPPPDEGTRRPRDTTHT